MTPDAEGTVRALIAAAGLEPNEPEIQDAIAGYPELRRSLDRLHDVAIDHEEEMQLIFRADR